jgi:hypothetical protein
LYACFKRGWGARCFNRYSIFIAIAAGKLGSNLSIAPMEQSEEDITHFICLKDITRAKKGMK